MLQIRQMGPQIGVEVTGIDVKTMDEATWNRICQAWLDHNVMVVRDQELTIPDLIAYSERFGPVTPHPSKATRHPEHPKITMLGVNKFDADGKLRDEIYRRGAEGWHTDGAYNQAPFKATQLYALAVPSRGGNTMFANAYAAYDSLPQRLKDRLDAVIGAFSYGGRRGKARLITPDAEYHHKWEKGDIVIWDNRCSYHRAAGDYPPEEDRIHWRVSINDFGAEALDEAAEERCIDAVRPSRRAPRL